MLLVLYHWTIWLAMGGLFFLLLIGLAGLSTISIEARVRKDGSNDDIEAHIRALFGLIRYDIKVPIVKIKGRAIQFKKESAAVNAGMSSTNELEKEIDAERVMELINRVKELVHLTYNLKGIVRQSLSRLEVKSLRWSTAAGTTDAMWTALSTGALWSAKTSVIGYISHMVKLQSSPELNVRPVYNENCFKTELSCLLQMKVIYALISAFQLAIRMKKNKSSFKLWRNMLSELKPG